MVEANNNSPVLGANDEGGLISRNITVNGKRTSVRLERDMWGALSDICRRERANVHEICSIIAAHRKEASSLTAAIRVFIMAYYRAAATEDGHMRAGHGNGVANGVKATIIGPLNMKDKPQIDGLLNRTKGWL